MDTINFAVLGTGGIGRRTLEVSTAKETLEPVAACDRHGVAVDHDGLDVSELLDATEGNIAGDGTGDTDARTDGGTAVEGGVKQHGADAGIVASEQGERTADPIGAVIEESEHLDAVLLALPNLEHDFIPRIAERFADAGYEGVLVDVLKRSRVIGMLDDREEELADSGITFVCGASAAAPVRKPGVAPAPQTNVTPESTSCSSRSSSIPMTRERFSTSTRTPS